MEVRKKRPRGVKKEAQGAQVSPLNPLSVLPASGSAAAAFPTLERSIFLLFASSLCFALPTMFMALAIESTLLCAAHPAASGA